VSSRPVYTCDICGAVDVKTRFARLTLYERKPTGSSILAMPEFDICYGCFAPDLAPDCSMKPFDIRRLFELVKPKLRKGEP
jgi:hypothetical protein